MKKDKSDYKKSLNIMASLKKLVNLKADDVLCIIVSVVIGTVISYLFYKSPWGEVSIIPIFIISEKSIRSYRKEKKREEMTKEFKDAMSSFGAAIRVGYSPENSAKKARNELSRIYGEKALLVKEFDVIIRKLSLGESIEAAFANLAVGTDIDEIREMSELFSVAKRSGGSLPAILADSVRMLDERARITEEIKTIITSKKLEQRIMCLMPVGILFYVNLTAPDFLAPLYTGLFGRTIMTIVLVIYIATVFVGERIMKVRI